MVSRDVEACRRGRGEHPAVILRRGQKEAGQAPGERRLARPLRSGDHPGVMQPIVVERRQKLGLGRAMAKDPGRLTRMRRGLELVRLGRWRFLVDDHSRASTMARRSAAMASGARFASTR